MRKNLFLIVLLTLFTISSVSAQSFLKKMGDAAKKITQTEQPANKNAETNPTQDNPAVDATLPVNFKLESTRYIGDRLLVSGKFSTTDDLRIMLSSITAITSDGDVLESKDMWFGGKRTSAMSFDNNLTADINYAVDIAFDVKGKQIGTIASLKINGRNHNTKANFTIPMKGIATPNPIDPMLSDPSIIEIYKDVYLKWTKAEESPNSFTLKFVIENKASKDQVIQFSPYQNGRFVDSDGTAYDAKFSLQGNINFPSETPIAGEIVVDKPLKLNQISLVEFASQYFKYKIKKLVIADK